MSIDLAASEHTPRYMEKFIDYFAGIHVSLRAKILISFFTVILLLALVNTLLILEVLRFNRQYAAIINNITTANSINGYIKPAIDTEMWNIVAGKKDFNAGNQYQIIAQVNAQIEVDDGEHRFGQIPHQAGSDPPNHGHPHRLCR